MEDRGNKTTSPKESKLCANCVYEHRTSKKKGPFIVNEPEFECKRCGHKFCRQCISKHAAEEYRLRGVNHEYVSCLTCGKKGRVFTGWLPEQNDYGDDCTLDEDDDSGDVGPTCAASGLGDGGPVGPGNPGDAVWMLVVATLILAGWVGIRSLFRGQRGRP